jgi:kumamolisin
MMRVVLKLHPKREIPDPAVLGTLAPYDRPPRMSHEEYASHFGSTKAAVDAVVHFARSHKLDLVSANAVQRMVVLAGTVREISAAFRVDLYMFESTCKNQAYRGSGSPLRLPQALHGIVTAVAGLDNREQGAQRSAAPVVAKKRSFVRTAFTPPQLARIYNFPHHLDGSGQTIALLEFNGAFVKEDLDVYFRRIGVKHPEVSAISVDGTQNMPGTHHDAEVMLDIEVAGGAAPGAKIAVYFARNDEAGWLEAITAAVHDEVRRPSVLSISWGYPEFQGDMLAWTPQVIAEWDRTLREAAQLGVTVIASAGDDGSLNGVDDGKVHVDFPASSPYVLACGGTTLVAKNGRIIDEFVWNDGSRKKGGGGTSGGGVSEHFARPSWQSDPGLNMPLSHTTGFAGRGVPDVAANADPRTGYIFRVDGFDAINGGTSASAPLWAALIARVNEQLSKKGSDRTVGYFNPLLYGRIGASEAFHDIVNGSNDALGTLGAYSAGTGWDACSGWGTPDGIQLTLALTGTMQAEAVKQETQPGLLDVMGASG